MSAPKIMLIFGEDETDRQSLRHIIRAIISKAAQVDIKPIRHPITLARGAEHRKRKRMADEIASFARSFEKNGSQVCVVAHRDCDAIEPAHQDEIQNLEGILVKAGVRQVVVAAPAWELETWWMLFPHAIRKVRACWKTIDYGAQNVGLIENSKQRLIRDLRPTDATDRRRCPDYCEGDGIKIAQQLVEDSSHMSDIKAKCASFTVFRKCIEEIFALDRPANSLK
jgi:hypothetical protein